MCKGVFEFFNLFQKDASTSNCKLFFSPVWISIPTFGIKPNDVNTFALASNCGYSFNARNKNEKTKPYILIFFKLN